MAGYAISRWVFLRLLGIVYVCAFASLLPQIVGLAGAGGIAPAGVSDTLLRGVCVAGTILGLALAAGAAPLATAALCWAMYWWLGGVCGEFLAYQWDALLLEAGVLALLVAPAVVRERWQFGGDSDPPRIAVWLMWWLVFRLMFGSGAVKLASGDPTWRNLTAMMFHYETQPLPNPIAFYAHHLPAAFNKASTAATLGIELLAPWTILSPRLRVAGAATLVSLQAMIALTGNFAFFNLLSAALCVFLIDDGTWRRAFTLAHAGGSEAASRLRASIAGLAAAIIVPVSVVHFSGSLGFLPPGWELIGPVARVVAPLRSISSYGLFAVMTTTRPEIIVEGSNDGQTWIAYEFRYKPGDLNRRPSQVAPHQPRLDWQMWFAALGRFEENPWFQNFCVRLLQASPEVRALMAADPFDGRPPKYVRARLYRYRFADLSTHRATGAWWTREYIGEYSPVMSLQ
jgi:hypothetical protein